MIVSHSNSPLHQINGHIIRVVSLCHLLMSSFITLLRGEDVGGVSSLHVIISAIQPQLSHY